MLDLVLIDTKTNKVICLDVRLLKQVSSRLSNMNSDEEHYDG
jgi:hypothetical protein